MIASNRKISVIMPGFNEGSQIFNNLLETVCALQEITENFEIIFVNDGSTDDTLANAKRAAGYYPCIRVIDCPNNGGKGNALKIGVEQACGDYIAFLDADLDIHPSQLKRFFEIIEEQKADAVIGSKLHPESKSDYPKRRVIISIGYYLLLFFLFRLNIRDTQTGIKLFKGPEIKAVMQQILIKRFAYDIEVLAILNRRKCRIVDAPIFLNFKRDKRWGRIRFKDIMIVFQDTLAVFYRMYIQRYYD